MKAKLAMLAAALVANSVWGADYYVSSVNPARGDANPGTSATAPWATMDKVKSAWGGLTGGDTVHMERGSVWNLSFSGDYWYVTKGGTSSNAPITLRGDDYGSGAKPIIRRTGGGTACGFITVQRSYITMRDFIIDGGHSDYAQNTTGLFVGRDDAALSNVQILNMTMRNLGGDTTKYICGIWLGSSGYPVSDCLIQGNEVSDYAAHGLNHYSSFPLINITWRNNVVKNAYAGGRFPSANSALQICSGSSGCVFEYNYLEDKTTTEACIFGFGKYGNDTGTNQIRYNVIANSGMWNVLFTVDQSGKKLLYDIYGNIVYNAVKSGVAIHPYNSYAAGTRFRIYNNTFFRNVKGGGDTSKGELELRPECVNTEIQAYNNLFCHATAGTTVALAVNSGFNGSLAHGNNLYWHEGGTGNAVVNDGSTYTVANVAAYEPSARNTSPAFSAVTQPPTQVSSTNGAAPTGLSVSATSGAIGGGAKLGAAFGSDIQGIARPASGAWTIGAYEYAVTAPAAPAAPMAPTNLHVVP